MAKKIYKIRKPIKNSNIPQYGFGDVVGSMAAGAGGGALAGAPVGGIGALPGALIGGGMGLIQGLMGEASANKLEKEQEEALSKQNYMTSYFQNKGPIQSYAPTFPFGGSTPDTEVELEYGEVFRTPDGEITKVSEDAPAHENGGVRLSLAEGTQVLGKRNAVNGEEYKDVGDGIYKNYNNINKILKNPKSTRLQKSTAERSMKNIQGQFDGLFQDQQEDNNFSSPRIMANGGLVDYMKDNPYQTAATFIPGLVNMGRGLFEKANEIDSSKYTTPTLQYQKPIDTSDIDRQITGQYRSAEEGLRGGLSRGQYMSNRIGLLGQTEKALSDRSIKEQYANRAANQRIDEVNANIQARNASTRLGIEQENLAAKAAKSGLLTQGISDITRGTQFLGNERTMQAYIDSLKKKPYDVNLETEDQVIPNIDNLAQNIKPIQQTTLGQDIGEDYRPFFTGQEYTTNTPDISEYQQKEIEEKDGVTPEKTPLMEEQGLEFAPEIDYAPGPVGPDRESKFNVGAANVHDLFYSAPERYWNTLTHGLSGLGASFIPGKKWKDYSRDQFKKAGEASSWKPPYLYEPSETQQTEERKEGIKALEKEIARRKTNSNSSVRVGSPVPKYIENFISKQSLKLIPKQYLNPPNSPNTNYYDKLKQIITDSGDIKNDPFDELVEKGGARYDVNLTKSQQIKTRKDRMTEMLKRLENLKGQPDSLKRMYDQLITSPRYIKYK